MLLLIPVLWSTVSGNDDVCSYAVSGSSFDLSPLRVDDLQSRSYLMESASGSEYSYIFNVCGPVTPVDLPRVCSNVMGAVLQYKLGILAGGCWVAGKFDAGKDQTFALIDSKNPAKGISLTYANGGSCSNGVVRSTTLDVYCANTEASVKTAYEVEARACAYHITMESYYGCPTECAITASGLCNSRGTCTTDDQTGSSYCLCQSGYSGEDCTQGEGTGHEGDLDNDLIASIPYMYSADTEQRKWKGDLLLLIAGMCISMCLGLCFIFIRQRYRRAGGYSELEVVGEEVQSMNVKDEDDTVYFHKGVGV